MRLTIFGATGRTGTCLIEQGLAAGHEVTAVVRDPGRLAVADRSRLRVTTADVLDPAAIVGSVTGADAVVSAVGPRGAGNRSGICQRSTQSIVQAMQKAGARRLVTVSGSIVADDGDSPALRYLLKPLFRATLLRHACTDMRQAEAQVRGSELDWTIMRPPRLTDQPGTGTYRTAVDRNPAHASTVPRADLAACILGLLSDPATVHRYIGIAS
jgi:putative NADH-flavin reductase